MTTAAPPSGDTRFEELVREWEVATRAVARQQRIEAARITAEWDPRLGELRSEVRDLRARGRWLVGRSDYLGILGMGRAEIRHSALIAWLLDPTGTHGLGSIVLEGLMGYLFADQQPTGLEWAQPRCEVPRDDRRADIVVRGRDFLLIIENKVDAPEDCDQCNDLYRLFKDEVDPRFVLLCPEPDPSRPHSASGAAKRAFKVLGYGEFQSILGAALQQTQEDRWSSGRHIAEDYRRTLEREFP